MHNNDERYSSIAIASLSSALISGKYRKTRSSAKSKFIHKRVPGAAGSHNFDTIHLMNGYEKSPNFTAPAQTVFGTDQKNHRGRIAPPLPPVIGLSHHHHYVVIDWLKTIDYLTGPQMTLPGAPISKRHLGHYT